jgi:hypothetical protein
MKKALVVIIGVILMAGCSKNTQFTQDLTGTWYIYKLTLNNIQQDLTTDSLNNYTVTYTGDGHYTEQNIFGTDTIHNVGTWQFQDSYGKLVMTDTARVQTTYTIFNLQGNHVELLRNGYDRYMRKNP